MEAISKINPHQGVCTFYKIHITSLVSPYPSLWLMCVCLCICAHERVCKNQNRPSDLSGTGATLQIHQVKV